MKSQKSTAVLVVFMCVATVTLFGCSEPKESAQANKAQNESEQSTKEKPAKGFMKSGVSGEHSIHVVVTNISQQSGKVTAALYDCEDSYRNGGSVRGQRVAVDGDSIEFDFENLPAGRYAIRVFHDVNDNQDIQDNCLVVS